MSRRIQGRVFTAAALVAAFALANPVHAASRRVWVDPSGLFLHAWQRLAGAAPRMRAQSRRSAATGHSITKEGAGVDPQGGSAARMNTPLQSDGRAGVDPNG